MNGTAAGTWDAKSGFGLINAITAINALDVLRVLSTDPANGSTVTVTPSAITVTFSKPVDFSTVQSSDLVFSAAPAGVTVNLGKPVAIDDPKFPTKVAFPFSFSYSNPPTTTANGTYTFSVSGPDHRQGREGPGSFGPSPSRSTTRRHPRSPTPRCCRGS